MSKTSIILIFPILLICVFTSSFGCFNYDTRQVESDEPVVDYDNATFEDLPVLITQMISSLDMDTQQRAGAALAILRSQDGGVDAIIQLLNDDDPQLRADTVVLLGYYIGADIIFIEDEPSLIPSLLDALEDENSQVRLRTCGALDYIARVEAFEITNSGGDASNLTGLMGDATPEVVQALIGLLDDEDPDVRVTTANALNYIGLDSVDAVPVLIRMLEDDDFLVRVGAAVALTGIAQDATVAIPVLIEGIEENKTYYSPRVVPDAGWDYSWHVARTCAIALEYIGPDAYEALPVLIRLLVDPEIWTRRAACEALATIDPTGEVILSPVIELLSHDDPYIRRTATYALGLLGASAIDALPILKGMLEDPIEPVREVRGDIRAAIERIESAINQENVSENIDTE